MNIKNLLATVAEDQRDPEVRCVVADALEEAGREDESRIMRSSRNMVVIYGQVKESSTYWVAEGKSQRLNSGGWCQDKTYYRVPLQGPILSLRYNDLRGSSCPGRYWLDGFDISQAAIEERLPGNAEKVTDQDFADRLDSLFLSKLAEEDAESDEYAD